MKIRKGRPGYKIPNIGTLLNAWIEEGGIYRTRTMMYLQPYEKIKELPQKQGQPRFIGIANGRMALWPTPDKSYEVTIRYYPPAMEA